MEKLDILNREEFVNKLVNLTENISANKTSTSFGINGVWGCGKSFVLDMYEERLNEIQSEETADNKYFVIRYNCWKYDYYEEPLVAIVAALAEAINNKIQLLPDDKQKKYKGKLITAGKICLSLATAIAKGKFGIDLSNISDATKTIDEGKKAETSRINEAHSYDTYFQLKKILIELKTTLNELAEHSTVVLMVDELDRCLPEYSIKVLERLHHLTEDTNSIITVLAIDKDRLRQSITHLFGYKESNEYLKKFIKFDVQLDKGVVSERIIEKYADYLKLFDKDLIKYDDSLEEFLQAAFDGIDPRTQEYLMERALIAHKIVCNNTYKDYSFMCMEIILTVFICVHGSDFCNTDSEFHFDRKIYNSKYVSLDVPFKSFLINKFEKLNLGMSSSRFADDPDEYYLPEKVTLYGAVLFLTSRLYKSRKDLIVYYAEEAYNTIANNVADLKMFAETIKFIS